MPQYFFEENLPKNFKENVMDWLSKVEALENGDSAEKAAAKIAKDIQGRSGIGNEFEQIDGDIVCEMLDEWAAIIREQLKAS